MNYDQLTIFYDGKCNLCFREIRHYKKLDKNNLIKTIDISANDFKAINYGLDEKDVQINMHSMNSKGDVFIGVDTFAEIWKRVSPYNKLVFILESEVLRPFFDWGYKVFAYKIRPKLPRRNCENGSCEIML
jgi:predicted DCC family thiol-disulfide oxidoreductase YuxK